MLVPYLFGLTALVIVPVLLALPVAFTKYDALSPPEPVGLDNFRRMAGDEQFWNGLRASLVLLVFAVPLRVGGALLLALLLRTRKWGFGLFRAVAYLPTVIPDVAYALLWLYILNPLYGPLNGLSQIFASGVETELMPAGGLPGIWLIDPNAAQVAVIIMLFFTLGEGFLLLLAALHEIPNELHEAAALDGASGLQQVFRITLPLLAPPIILLTVRDTIFTLQASFVAATLLTQGGPYYATSYLPYWIYQNITDFQRFGYGSAMAWVLYAVTGVVVLLQFWVARRWQEMMHA